MGRKAVNVVPFNEQAFRKRVKEGAGKTWKAERVDGVLGLVLIVQASGTGTFYFFYRNRIGEERKFRIGEFGPVSLSDARRRAQELRHKVEDGADPVGDEKAR